MDQNNRDSAEIKPVEGLHHGDEDLKHVNWQPLASLKSHPRNARTHSARQIKQIARSIERFGFLNPVLVDQEGNIVAGHGRCESARLLGWTSVPTLEIEHLSKAELRAYVLADNRLAEKAGWDRDLLAIELQGLIELDFDVEVTGFEMGEIDIILDDASSPDAKTPEDDIPQVWSTPVTRLGEMWVLGRHRLVCGDARDRGAYEAVLQGETAEFSILDPPYNVRIEGHASGLGRTRHPDFAMASGEMSQAEFTRFLSDSFLCLAAALKPGAIAMIAIDWRHLGEMLEAGHSAFDELKNVCVWTKNNAGMGTFYRSQHELFFIWKKGGAPHLNNFELGQHGRSRSNVWAYPGVNTFGKNRSDELALHPTVKPVALIADAIKDCSRRNGLVLDPFTGSGTIFIAAERTGRAARGIELEPHYCDVAVRRWQAFTGRDAVHAQTGRCFAEVAENRAVREEREGT